MYQVAYDIHQFIFISFFGKYLQSKQILIREALNKQYGLCERPGFYDVAIEIIIGFVRGPAICNIYSNYFWSVRLCDAPWLKTTHAEFKSSHNVWDWQNYTFAEEVTLQCKNVFGRIILNNIFYKVLAMVVSILIQERGKVMHSKTFL